MKNRLFIFTITVFYAYISFNYAYSEFEKKNAAILEFSVRNTSGDNASFIRDDFSASLVKAGIFTIIERQMMQEILTEQAFQQTGCTDSDCAVQIGRLVNAQFIILGNLSLVENEYIYFISIVNVETGKIEYTDKQTAVTITALSQRIKFTISALQNQYVRSDNNAEEIVYRNTVVISEKDTKNRSAAVNKLKVSARNGNVSGKWVPIQIGIFGPTVQLFLENFSVYGYSFTIISVRNISVKGGQFGLYNSVIGTIYGGQFGIFNTAGHTSGAQFGVVNVVKTATGAQFGVFNRSGILIGAQFGVINICDYLLGMQFGVININRGKSGPGFMPLINAGF